MELTNLERRQSIIQPSDSWISMPPRRLVQHRRTRLHRDDMVSERYEPCRIATQTSANIQYQSVTGRQEIHQPSVDGLER